MISEHEDTSFTMEVLTIEVVGKIFAFIPLDGVRAQNNRISPKTLYNYRK